MKVKVCQNLTSTAMKLPEKQDPAREPAEASRVPPDPARAFRVIELEDLGVLRIQGTDTVRFLQGQLSNDVAQLAAQGSQLAGYHNPQGRTIAVLRLVQAAPDEILAVLPREILPATLSRLSQAASRPALARRGVTICAG